MNKLTVFIMFTVLFMLVSCLRSGNESTHKNLHHHSSTSEILLPKIASNQDKDSPIQSLSSPSAQLLFQQSRAPATAPPAWTCLSFTHNNQIWMRSYFLGNAQFDWRIGAGGVISELRDARDGYRSMLSPSFKGEVTDRVVQWTIWSEDTRESSVNLPDFEKRFNVTQGGTFSNLIAPSIYSKIEKAGSDECVVSVLSSQVDQWKSEMSPLMDAHLPSKTIYTFKSGTLKIERFTLIKHIAHLKKARSNLDVYFEGWTPFAYPYFDSVAMSLNNQTGEPNWFYDVNKNLPIYPKWTTKITNGYSLVFRYSTRRSSPAFAVIFNRGGGQQFLNLFKWSNGVGVLPALDAKDVPVNSLVYQEINLFGTRGLWAGLHNTLVKISDNTQPSEVIAPNLINQKGMRVLQIYEELQKVEAGSGQRLDQLVPILRK